jgi:hypothetical protein
MALWRYIQVGIGGFCGGRGTTPNSVLSELHGTAPGGCETAPSSALPELRGAILDHPISRMFAVRNECPFPISLTPQDWVFLPPPRTDSVQDHRNHDCLLGHW